MTTTALRHGHRAESTTAHDAPGRIPLEIRKSRALAKALAWLAVSAVAAAALTYAVQGTHASGGARQFTLAIFALGAGGFTALTAHLSVTWTLIWCAVAAPQRSARRTCALKVLRLWSPRAARLAVVALGVSATALSLGNPSRAFAEAATPIATVTHANSASDSGGDDQAKEEARGNEATDASGVTTLGWAPTEEAANATSIPPLHATPEPEPSYAIAFSGSSESLPAPEPLPQAPSPKSPGHGEIAAPTREHRATHSDHTYTVKPGDTLWSIARQHLTHEKGERPTNGAIVREIDRIASLNPTIDNVDLIFPGQTFRL